MPSLKPPLWIPPPWGVKASESGLDMLRTELLDLEPELGDADTVAVPIGSADTRRTTLPYPESDLGDADTVAVPIGSADTLPCPRLDFADRPTLRAAPDELAALVRLTRPARARLSVPPPRPRSRAAPQPADRTHAVRMPDPGQTMPLLRVSWPVAAPSPGGARRHLGVPTQLWFAPAAPLVAVTPARPAPPSWWARLWSLLGFARSRRRKRGRHPGYHRQPIMRR